MLRTGGMFLDVTNVSPNPVIITGFQTLLPATYTPCAVSSCPGGSCTPSAACPSGTCATGFPYYPGGPACTGTSFPFQVRALGGPRVLRCNLLKRILFIQQVLFRRNTNCSGCTGSVRDNSFLVNSTGVYLKPGMDQSGTTTIYTNLTNVIPSASIPKGTAYANGSLPLAPAANPADSSWISAVNATLYGSNQIVDIPGNVAIPLAVNETIGLWFLFMDQTKSSRGTNGVVMGNLTLSDPYMTLVTDGTLRLSHAMQATTWNTANWANIRPWTGSVKYVVPSAGLTCPALPPPSPSPPPQVPPPPLPPTPPSPPSCGAGNVASITAPIPNSCPGSSSPNAALPAPYTGCPAQPGSANGGMLLDVINTSPQSVTITSFSMLVPAVSSTCATSGCPSGTCGPNLPFYTGAQAAPCIGGNNFPVQVLYRYGSIQDGSFLSNSSGKYLLPSVDYTSSPPVNVSTTLLANASNNGLPKGSVPGTASCDVTKWTVALTSNITNALLGGMNAVPGTVSIIISPGSTVSLWFLFLDGTRSSRATDSYSDPSVPLVSDGYLTLSHAMQATTINTANWNNIRPWSGIIKYSALCSSPPPPSPSPPPPSLVPNANVNAITTLNGYSLATFTAAPRAAFIAGVASLAGVPTSWVTITGATDASSRRRHLLGAAVSVQFSVQTYSGTSATSLASTLVSASTGGSMLSALNATFTSAGLTAPTSVSAIPASGVTTTVAGAGTNTVTKTAKPLKLGLGIGLGLGLGLIVIGAVVWRLFLRPKAIEEGQKSAVQLQPVVLVPVVAAPAAHQ
jgi:hypothetical protein